MKRFLSLGMVLLTWSLTMPAQAQTATDVNEGVRMTVDATTGAQVLSWWGRTGRTYFIQQSYDLTTWTYVPVVCDGGGIPDGMNFASTDARQFWRLQYTDASTGGLTGANADFDGDGLTNQQELDGGTAVFNPDTDGDGFSDGTEALAETDAKSSTSNPETDLFDVPLVQVAYFLSGPSALYYIAGSSVLQSEYSASYWLVSQSSTVPGNIYSTSYGVNGGMPSLPTLPARPDADSSLSTWSS